MSSRRVPLVALSLFGCVMIYSASAVSARAASGNATAATPWIDRLARDHQGDVGAFARIERLAHERGAEHCRLRVVLEIGRQQIRMFRKHLPEQRQDALVGPQHLPDRLHPERLALLVATDPPSGRVVLVNGIEAWVDGRATAGSATTILGLPFVRSCGDVMRAGLLFGVTPTDPVTFAGMLAVALVISAQTARLREHEEGPKATVTDGDLVVVVDPGMGFYYGNLVDPMTRARHQAVVWWAGSWGSRDAALDLPPLVSLTGGAALLLSVALVAGFLFWQRAKSKTSTAAAPEKSIAVLPLMNSTGDPANEYFSDGMSEEFISSLSRLQEPKVIGRTSSFQFKGKSDDSKTIGEKLGVYYLLEGSVRKSADRVRIAVALIKSGDGANVWSETYDRELKDIFAVQSEIAGAVAKQLKVALLGHNGQAAQLATAATPSNQNVEAYNALLQGNFYFNRRTAEDFRKAISYYEEAIRLDPRYALAYAKLSRAAGVLASNYPGSVAPREVEELIATARASAKRALERGVAPEFELFDLGQVLTVFGTRPEADDVHHLGGARRALQIAAGHADEELVAAAAERTRTGCAIGTTARRCGGTGVSAIVSSPAIT